MKFNKDKFEELLSPSESNFFKKVDAMIENQSDRLANAKIALRLLDYMDSKGLSRGQVADKLGISKQYLSRLLKGAVNITIGSAQTYGDKLGITLITVPDVSRKPELKAARYKTDRLMPMSIAYSEGKQYNFLS